MEVGSWNTIDRTGKSCAAGEHPEKRLGEQIDGDNRAAPSRQIEKAANISILPLCIWSGVWRPFGQNRCMTVHDDYTKMDWF